MIYDEDLKRRQEEHLKNIRGNTFCNAKCMHDLCTQCIGTGVKKDGSLCLHAISCPCHKCTPYC